MQRVIYVYTYDSDFRFRYDSDMQIAIELAPDAPRKFVEQGRRPSLYFSDASAVLAVAQQGYPVVINGVFFADAESIQTRLNDAGGWDTENAQNAQELADDARFEEQDAKIRKSYY